MGLAKSVKKLKISSCLAFYPAEKTIRESVDYVAKYGYNWNIFSMSFLEIFPCINWLYF